MRILYIDIDSQRPDHLGCYGYHRNTSPNIDTIAENAARFTNVYISDAPCLPSRTALFSGRNGFHTGVVNHAGTTGQPYVEGATRHVRDLFGTEGWMATLGNTGFKTATISSFGDRHAAWHWYAGFDEIYNPGKRGNDRADEVAPIALDWLDRNGTNDNWFLHVNFWDPHTPYRTPMDYGNPFENDPLPAWMTEEVRQRGWDGYGPHSPQEPHDFGFGTFYKNYPRLPEQLDSMEAVKQWIDGYDTGVRFVDDHIGQLMNKLAELGVDDETVIMISADHGENQGELNVWGDHQTADQYTCNIPLIIRWPGVTDGGWVETALHYHYDWAATMIEMVGGEVPESWDGQAFTERFKSRTESGRPFLVISQGTWACQRGVRFGYNGSDYLCLQTYHDGYKMLDALMLFDLSNDPHEQNNLAEAQPQILNYGLRLLAEWYRETMLNSKHQVDPLMTVIREGGPHYTQGNLTPYAERLRQTDRAHHAAYLLKQHANEI